MAGVALWGCDPSSGSDPQASLFALGWILPPTPEHKLISSVRALGKHLESDRNPPHPFLEVAVHIKSFSRLLPAQDDEKQPHLLTFHWAAKQSEHEEEQGKTLPWCNMPDLCHAAVVPVRSALPL